MMTSSVRKKIEEEWPSSPRLESDSEKRISSHYFLLEKQ